MSRPRGVAFKVTYNDGGAMELGGVGYRGICSDATVLYNVRERKATNCAAGGTPCARFVQRGLKPKDRPREPASVANSWCYEASLLKGRRWGFGAGYYHRGARRGQPIPMRGGQPGDLAILTTRLPGASEAERCIFAIYRIGKHYSAPQHWLECDGTMRVRIPDDLLRQVRYWDYAGGVPDWRTGLFRYLDEDTTERLVSELMFTLGDRDERDVILRALPDLRPRPRGRAGAWGAGGEGAAHRQLKERVARDPTLIGLPAEARATMEYRFLSGDCVDIAFVLPNDRRAVVEIETYFAEPGAHQTIKYRALMEAELRVPLNSGKVEGILVAHEFDKPTEEFARRYAVRCATVPPH